MKKLWGWILYGLAKLLDGIFGLFIRLLTLLVGLVEQIRGFFAPLLGCIGVFLFASPIILLPILAIPGWLWVLVLILVFFPLIGRGGVAMLDYGRYVLTEYLYDLSIFYRGGAKHKQSFASYSFSYRRKRWEEEERKRAEAQKRQREKWDEIFNAYFGNRSNFSSGGFGFYDFGSQGQGGRGGYSNGAYQSGNYNSNYQRQSPLDDFKREYERHCDTLGLGYNTTEYEVKLAYRKLAKKYHPDVNKEPGATARFQEISAAYAFLSKENIERYKKYFAH